MVNERRLIKYKMVILMIEFNPSKNEKTVISIRIPTSILNDIDKRSGEIDIFRNEFIMQCINFALKNYKKDEKNG